MLRPDCEIAPFMNGAEKSAGTWTGQAPCPVHEWGRQIDQFMNWAAIFCPVHELGTWKILNYTNGAMPSRVEEWLFFWITIELIY